MKALQIHITLFPQTGLSEPGIFELVAHKDDCFWFTMIGWDRFATCAQLILGEPRDEFMAHHMSSNTVFVSVIPDYVGIATM